MSIYKRFLKDSSAVLLAQIVSFVTSLLTGIIIARILGPTGKGTLRLLTLVPLMITSLGCLGIQISNVYFIGRKKYEYQLIAANSFFIAILLSIVVAALYPLLIPKFFGAMKVNVPNSIKLITYFMIPLGLLTTYLSSFLIGLRRIVTHSYIGITRSVTLLLLIIVCLFIFRLGLYGALMVNIIVPMIALSLMVISLKDTIKLKPHYERRILKDSIIFGIKGHLGNVAQYFNYRLDFFIVAIFLNPKEVGFYSVAVAIAELIWYIPRAISTVLFPMTASSCKESSKEFLPNIARKMIITIFPTALLILLVGKPLISLLYGKQFSASILPMLLLLPGILVMSVGKTLGAYIAGRGKPEYNTIAAFVSLSITVILDIILIPRMGISGAAIATSFSYILATIIMIYYYIKLSGNRAIDLIRIRKSDFDDYWKLYRQIFMKKSGNG